MPPDTTQHIGWYEITKDIIIPALGIGATVTIGIIVAGILKKREEKAKIKSLLIDNYMKYLNVRVNFAKQEQLGFIHSLYRDIYGDYDSFFGKDANSHNTRDIIKERNDKVNKKLESLNDEETNWSPFTFQFCFLLGTKIYGKNVQYLENEIIKMYMSDRARDTFLQNIKVEIKNDTSMRGEMNSSQKMRIEKALDSIEHKIGSQLNQIQRKYFEPFENKIADLIDAY
jgi:hypothetical protein